MEYDILHSSLLYCQIIESFNGNGWYLAVRVSRRFRNTDELHFIPILSVGLVFILHIDGL